MKKARLFTITAVIALLIALGSFACAKVKLEVMDAWGVGPWTEGLYKEWSKVLEERLPDIEVEFIMVEKGNSIEKLTTLIAAGAEPDVSLGSSPEFGVHGHVLDLGPFFERDEEISLDDFFPTCVEYCTIIRDGKPFIWGIPGNSDSRPLWVNLDMLSEAGIGYEPETPWTWDEFVDMGRKLTERNSEGQIEHYAFDLPKGWPWSHSPFIWTNGGAMFQRNPKTGWIEKAVFDNPKTIEALTWLVELINRNIASPPGVGASFLAGKSAMTQSWMSIASWDIPFPFNIMPIPVPEAGMPSINIANGSSMGSIMKSTEHPEEAWKVLKLLAGDEGDWIRNKYMPHPPALVNSRFMDQWKARYNFRTDIFLQGILTGRLLPYSKLTVGAGEITQIMSAEYSKMWNEEIPPSEAVKNIDSRVNAILAEQQR